MGTFIRLVEYGNADNKEKEFFNRANWHLQADEKFKYLPNYLYSYWISPNVIKTFEDATTVADIADGKVGLQTGNNDVFLRFWFEVDQNNIAFDGDRNKRWYLYSKGGSVRRWYGNNEYVVDWKDDGKKVKNYDGAYPRNTEYYFRDGITWSDVKSGAISMRKMPPNSAFDTCAPCLFSKNHEDILLAFFNTKVAQLYMDFMTSPLHYTCGAVLEVPMRGLEHDYSKLVNECVLKAKKEWDSFETSWDFSVHPLIKDAGLIQDVFEEWERETEEDFMFVKNSEEEITQKFIDEYQFADEISSTLDNSEITMRCAEVKREIKSLISYAVGCVLGRYSLKEEGLIFAGGKWDESKYLDDFKPCEYGIIPITENQYFSEDLCTRVIDFIKVVYGEDTLNENLKFIAKALKPDSYESPKKIIRDYLFNGFFDNHYQIYQHRPIYWQLDSGKAGGFRAIMYMHRFNENTLSTVRTEYIQELLYKYEDEIQRLQHKLGDAKTTAEKNEVKKQATAIDKKLVECTVYDDLLNHVTSSIQNYVFDLDDGVKTNYAKFLSIDGDKTKNVLTVIKL